VFVLARVAALGVFVLGLPQVGPSWVTLFCSIIVPSGSMPRSSNLQDEFTAIESLVRTKVA
jgi:hypothetical protein